MIIKPTDRTMKNLLEGGFYKIPRFQRPYSWDKENVDDFWNDAIANQDPDYFIGSFVFYREPPNADTYMVVDGQQRLTTATLLLAVIRNAFDTLGYADLAKGIQKLIEREDINNQLRFILLTETSYPFLQEYIQKHGAAQLTKKPGREEEALELAFEYLRAQVNTVLQAVDSDASILEKKKLEEKKSRLLRLRDNALRLQMIVVELTTEDEAYLIFETLNTRGKDLGIADLVKNLLTRLLKPANKDVDVPKEKWHSILALFDASAAGIDVNGFIYHAWMSRYSYTGREKLFRAIRARVNKAAALQFLDDLVTDADLYRQVFEPEATTWTKQEADVAASLRALNIFRVVQPVPMTLAILRSYRKGELSLKQTRAALRSMEDFHVQFTAVTAQRTGGGTARMYAASAELLSKSSDPNSRATVLKEFKGKMRQRIPTYAEFEANFGQIEFFAGNTKQKGLVQYLLQRIDAFYRTGAPPNYEKMTIEHVAPENPVPGNGLSSAQIGKLGNLVLLHESLNNQLGNKDFKTKRKHYKDSGSPLDPVLEAAHQWTDSEIEQRTKALAKVAYEEIFVV